MAQQSILRKRVLNDSKLVYKDLIQYQERVKTYQNFLKDERIPSESYEEEQLEDFLNLDNYIVKPDEINSVNPINIADSTDLIRGESFKIKRILKNLAQN